MITQDGDAATYKHGADAERVSIMEWLPSYTSAIAEAMLVAKDSDFWRKDCLYKAQDVVKVIIEAIERGDHKVREASHA